MRFKTDELTTYVSRGIAPKYTDIIDGAATVVNQKCIRDYQVNLELARLNDLSKRKVPTEKLVQKYDVLVNSTGVGTLGRVGQFLGNETNLTVDTHVTIVRPDKDVIDPLFFGYLMKSKQSLIESFATGTTGQTELSRDSIKEMEVSFVENREHQQAIGNFLLAIDRKLQLNKATNQTLEQMAQTIFKSWFVDFDPVKAKMAGEQPEGMDAATASLFPEKFVESEFGLIPDGWEPKQLKDIVELAYGKALKKTDRVAGDVPVYGSGGLTGYHNQSLVEGPGIIVGRKGTVGSVYWEPKAFYPIDTVFYVKPKAGYSLKYCHLVLQNLGLKDMNTDAAVPGLNRNNAYRLDVITPSESVLKKFEEMMQSFQSKVDANNVQNASLESLRDTLLPKLLSGEIELETAKEQ
ncbi:restriction endonuclease subunit S [Vibrio rotiferianus]|uniref:restriction endonuclease subunit S n=1 Tax=Vibrio rotiferianus TaxID=190895 RepID=UPI002893C89C|nr:Type I restriction-modification system, specificity subunit S [Vibrio rotiferianus]